MATRVDENHALFPRNRARMPERANLLWSVDGRKLDADGRQARSVGVIGARHCPMSAGALQRDARRGRRRRVGEREGECDEWESGTGIGMGWDRREQVRRGVRACTRERGRGGGLEARYAVGRSVSGGTRWREVGGA